MFRHPGFDVERVVSILAYSTEGIFGIPLGASATIVAMFMIFAAFYNGTDAGEQFLQLSKDIFGGLRAGPAKMAVVASSLFGTISGSTVANVVGSGTFTIPAMKRMGFSREFAGAVEAVLPPAGNSFRPSWGPQLSLWRICWVFRMQASVSPPYVPDINVKCITHRNDPLLQCLLSQMPPSESSLIRSLQRESKIFSFLRGLDPEKIIETFAARWGAAMANPLAPRWVEKGMCQQNISGDGADAEMFPNPLWTRRHDPGRFFTGGCLISRDPETGEVNVGTYRSQVKGPRRTGVHFTAAAKHLSQHIQGAFRMGRPLPVVMAVGVDPALTVTSISALPRGVDEMAVAGALRGEPIEVVKALTCDLPVPAAAEIVIEGEINPKQVSEEGPFGEYAGYMGPRGRETLKLRVKDVHIPESGGAAAHLIISIDKRFEGEAWQAASGAWAIEPTLGKFTIVTDADIDIRAPFALSWAVAFRARPDSDVQIIRDTAPVGLDPSLFRPGDIKGTEQLRGSKLLIDATMKFPYPEQSLPSAADLEKVAARWSEYGFK